MKINIQTEVQENYKSVYKRFDKDLFLALKPPLMPLELLRFDGSSKGDQVHLKLGVGTLSMRWDALIIEHGVSEKECYFIDEGIQLPFFLKKWKHRHRILKVDEDTSIIVDDIYFETPNVLMDYLFYPILYMQFYMRKPVYKKYFDGKS